MSDYSRFFFADVGNWFSVMFRLRGSGLQLGPSRQPNSVPRSGQFEDRCLWKRSRRCRGSLFLNTFRELFCAVSSEDQELKDRRTDEHYGIERTAAFRLGRQFHERGQLRFNGLGKAAALPDVRRKKQSRNGFIHPAVAMIQIDGSFLVVFVRGSSVQE